MNETWNTINMDAFFPRGKSRDEVSMNDINALLKGRSYAQEPLAYNKIPEYDPDDIRELEEYCKKRGIVGVNFGNKSPKAVLEMLRGMTNEKISKRGMLYG